MFIFHKNFDFISVLIGIVAIVNGTSTKYNYFESIIEKVNNAEAKWNAGYNFDPNIKLSYFERLMGVIKYPETLKQKQLSVKTHLINDLEIPDDFDSRNNWPLCRTIGQIRDQGNCGSCWAVSAAAVLSDRVCIATNGNFTLPLSEEELLSCCNFCGSGCKGGHLNAAWMYIHLYGMVTGGGYNSNIGCQPYDVKACDHHVHGGLSLCDSLPPLKTPKCVKMCTNPSYNSSFDTDHLKKRELSVHRAYRIDNDIAMIQKDILLHGPVQTALQTYSDFVTYKSGVYHHVTGHCMGMHAVKILGWGVEAGTPYWLAANTWNTHWGNKGFFKILRGENHCGVESEIWTALPVVIQDDA